MCSSDQINFRDMSSQRFEELCYDLLVANGFRRLAWRQGGADSGRDIEAYWPVSTGVTDDFEERWFFECKKYEAGVPVSEIMAKFAWADADTPRHLVMFVSSYLTKSARDWIERIRDTKSYMIHLVEGKRVKTLLDRNPEIFRKYFPSTRKDIAARALRDWVEYATDPYHTEILHMLQAAKPSEFSLRECAFIFLKSRKHSILIDNWLTENDMQDYGIKHLLSNAAVRSELILNDIIDKDVIDFSDAHSRDGRYVLANFQLHQERAIYLILKSSLGSLEILFLPRGESVDIRLLADPEREIEAARNKIREQMARKKP